MENIQVNQLIKLREKIYYDMKINIKKSFGLDN